MAGSLILWVDGHWANPYDCAPYVGLREKGVPFTTAVALVNRGVSAPVKFHAITGLEPALQQGDFWVAESLAIVEYLEEAFPAPEHARLWPSDLRERARARQVMSYLRMELNEMRIARPSTWLFYTPPQPLPPLPPDAARQAEALVALVERLGPQDGALFGAWCIADVDVAFTLMRLIHHGYPVSARVRAYVEAVWQRPSLREYIEHPRPPYPPAG
jgi:glutathione S-transferase